MQFNKSEVNPIKGIVHCFSDTLENFSQKHLTNLQELLASGGLIADDIDDVYACMVVLEEMKLIEIVWDNKDRPVKVKRTGDLS